MAYSNLRLKVFIACAFLIFACGCGNTSNSQNGTQLVESEATSVNQSNSDERRENLTVEKGNWIYQDSTDPMTDEILHMAICKSNEMNSICGTMTELYLNLSNTKGISVVMLGVTGGVLRQNKLPMAHVRFDKGKVDMWSVHADGERIQYIVAAEDFINQLKKSRKCAIKVEAQDGRTGTYTFNTEGLIWNY